MKFSEHVQRIQREYHHEKITRSTAVAMMEALMYEFRMLGEDEFLIDIPDDFGKFYEHTGYLGEFIVQQTGSRFKWRRSYQDRNLGRPQTNVGSITGVKLFTEPPPSQRAYAGTERRKKALTAQEKNFFAYYEPQVAEGRDDIEASK